MCESPVMEAETFPSAVTGNLRTEPPPAAGILAQLVGSHTPWGLWTTNGHTHHSDVQYVRNVHAYQDCHEWPHTYYKGTRQLVVIARVPPQWL